MNIKQLETFVRIVEDGTFAAAANSLHTTQSTVSARVKELERYLGAALFDRSSHRAQLTPKGHELYQLARDLVDMTSSVAHRIRDTRSVTGVVRMGVVGVVANTWLPKLVSELCARYPRLDLKLDMSLTRTLLERLRDRQLDLAIVAGPVGDPSLASESLGYDEFVWVAGAGVVRPDRPLGPADLVNWPILSLSEDSHHHPVIDRWFRSAGVVCRSKVSSNNMNVVAMLTAQGLGVSLLPRHCYRQQIEAGRLVVLNTVPAIPRVEFTVIWRADHAQPLIRSIVALAAQASELPRLPGDALPSRGASTSH
ncbi:MAG TPA: LysR family transcriptional regulator [Burkholderiaceae bacterium]|nr:LysR family transcriptional regulator [Burkholderiaceae bacterium]